MDDLVGFLIISLIILLIFAFCAIVIKRHWIDKRWINSESQFVGRNIYMQFQNADKKRAIEHVIFKKEDEKNQDFGGLRMETRD